MSLTRGLQNFPRFELLLNLVNPISKGHLIYLFLFLRLEHFIYLFELIKKDAEKDNYKTYKVKSLGLLDCPIKL